MPFPRQGGPLGESATWGLAQINETELRAVLFELDPTGSRAKQIDVRGFSPRNDTNRRPAASDNRPALGVYTHLFFMRNGRLRDRKINPTAHCLSWCCPQGAGCTTHTHTPQGGFTFFVTFVCRTVVRWLVNGRLSHTNGHSQRRSNQTRFLALTRRFVVRRALRSLC